MLLESPGQLMRQTMWEASSLQREMLRQLLDDLALTDCKTRTSQNYPAEDLQIPDFQKLTTDKNFFSHC